MNFHISLRSAFSLALEGEGRGEGGNSHGFYTPHPGLPPGRGKELFAIAPYPLTYEEKIPRNKER
jgi:hypothetical protein